MTAAMNARAPSITTPSLDVLMTGGLSIVAMGALLTWSLAFDGSVAFVDHDWLTLAILLNATHFMASYRLLYVSRAEIIGNPWSAIYVPVALIALLCFAAVGESRGWIVQQLVLGSSIYLAWHYTGQAWGMVSAFSRILGVDYTRKERLCIQGGTYALLALHVLFALSGRVPPANWIDQTTYVRGYGFVFQIVVGLAALSLVAGAWAFQSARARGQSVPLRAVLPWLALYFWYPFWYFVPGGFVWVQLSHALQYLAFPMRVEANRYTRTGHKTLGERIRHGVLVYFGLALAGAFVLQGPPLAAHAFGPGWYSSPDTRVLFQGFVACIAIHHYFIDGAVWKLRNPKVRGELLEHLR